MIDTEASYKWEEIDDDLSIAVHSVQNTVIVIDDSDDGDEETDSVKPRVNHIIDLTQETNQELVEDSDCEIIDDEFDRDLNQRLEILSDLFSTDTLLPDFNDINTDTRSIFDNSTQKIRQELVDNNSSCKNKTIESINCESDGDSNESLDIFCDTSIIDDLFSTDILSSDINDSESETRPFGDITNQPIIIWKSNRI